MLIAVSTCFLLNDCNSFYQCYSVIVQMFCIVIFVGMVNRISNFRQLKLTKAVGDGNQLHAGMVFHGKDPLHPQVS